MPRSKSTIQSATTKPFLNKESSIPNNQVKTHQNVQVYQQLFALEMLIFGHAVKNLRKYWNPKVKETK